MSSAVRGLSRLGCRLLQQSQTNVSGSNSLKHASRNLSVARKFTRSLWNMCSSPSQLQAGVVRTSWPRTCGCCGLHTEGDKEMADFLSEEIKLEKSNEKGKLPTVKGFELKSREGANVVLEKKTDTETVTIKFNINHTVEDSEPVEFKEGDAGPVGPTQMVSRPPFVVEITKAGSDQTLALQCVFPMEEPQPEGDDQAYVDMIEVQDVALLKGTETWDDKVYTLSGQVMDGNLYDMMLNMLEERGVDGDFVEELVNLSTSHEHTTYISFLEQLKEFASCAK